MKMVEIWIKSNLISRINEETFVPSNNDFTVGKYPSWANSPNEFARVKVSIDTYNRWKAGGSKQLLKG